MEAVYHRFEAYDFGRDDNFQSGLKSIQANGVTDEEHVLKLKIYFYNRFVEPVRLESYREWMATRSSTSQMADDEQHHTMQGNPLETCPDAPSLSFAQVFRMIEAGEEIPGLQKLDVRPCHEPPTTSQMTRKAKPWEKAVVSSQT